VGTDDTCPQGSLSPLEGKVEVAVSHSNETDGSARNGSDYDYLQ
jgi:hypothetical protein